MFQIGLTPETGSAFPQIGVGEINFGAVFGFLALAVAIIAVIFTVRFILRRKHAMNIAFRKVVLLVTMPKESAEKSGEQEKTKTLQEIQEKISAMETLLAALGGMKRDSGIKSWFLGEDDSTALEIVVSGGLIYFYLAAPRKSVPFLEQQIHAAFPLAQVEETPDYNIFSPKGAIAAAYLKFKRASLFPIKTYKKLEGDPLNSLTNAMSKFVAKDEGAAIQYILRPVSGKWRKKSHKVTGALVKGESLNDALGGFFHDFWKAVKPPKKEGEAGKEPHKLSPLEEEMVKAIEEKSSKAAFDLNIRLLASADTMARAEDILGNLVGAFNQYNIYEYGNSFVKSSPWNKVKLISDFIFRGFNPKFSAALNTEELASLYHFPLPTTETPNIVWLAARSAAPPNNLPKEGVLLGKSVYRGVESEVRIKLQDRLRHFYTLGRSGTGKTHLFKFMAIQDMEMGNGVCIIDPHGDFCEDILAHVPRERADDVIFFDPADMERSLGMNMFEYDPKYPEQKTFVVNEVIGIFDKLYDLKQTGGPIFEQYMRNAALLIMEDPESGSTMMEISKVLAQEDFRKYKLSKCKNPVVRDFWVKEAEKAGGEAALANVVQYITSKLTQFVANDFMRPIIAQQKSAFNFREVMDQGKILVISLSKGRIGDMNAYLLGMIIVGKILMAAMSRTDIPEAERKPFFMYIDEFQNVTTGSIASILSEARKYGLGLNITHQYIGQLVKNNDTSLRDAVFGNTGTIGIYRIGVEDAQYLEKEFAPVFTAFDLVNVPARTLYLKLLIDGTASKPFNMSTLPVPPGNPEMSKLIKELSRLKYGRDRALIEAEIMERAKATEMVEEEGTEGV